jgi:hypothetical protein
VLCTPPPRDPNAKEPRPGYLNRAPPPGPPYPSTRRPPPLAPQTLARARRRRRRDLDSAADAPSRSTSGAAQGGEAPAGAVGCRSRASRCPIDLAGVCRPRRHVDRPLRRNSAATTAPPCFACSRASCRCRPRITPSPGTLDWVRRRAPPPPAAARCRLQPAAVALAACARSQPSD